MYMKKFLLLFGIASFLMSCGGNETKNIEEEIEIDTVITFGETEGYDSLYAEELGADEYGMKPYVMAFLKEGPNRDLDSAAAAELQMAHMENINKMAEDGKLVLAGPFYGEESGELRGIYIFDATMEEAKELTNSDPAVQEGSLIMELIPWYGSAALMEVNNIHNKIAKTPI